MERRLSSCVRFEDFVASRRASGTSAKELSFGEQFYNGNASLNKSNSAEEGERKSERGSESRSILEARSKQELPPKSIKETDAESGGISRFIWSTRQIVDTRTNRELYIKTTVRELIIYIAFLLVICFITFGMTSSVIFYYNKVMSDLFLGSDNSDGDTFRGISSIKDFWNFARGRLLDGIYWTDVYNDTKQELYIYYENKLLGLPRLRMVRVQDKSCTIYESFKTLIKGCFADYSPGIEEKGSFGPATVPPIITAFRHKKEEEIEGSFPGTITSYEGGGYVQILPKSKSQAADVIQYLHDNRWIVRGSRAVFIDFTVYNANINLFCVIRLIVEFPATGGALVSFSFRPVKLIRYVTTLDTVIMAAEVLFVLFTLYYIGEEYLEIRKLGWAYLHAFWNFLDIVVVLISLVCIGFNLYRTAAVSSKLEALLQKPNDYPDFQELAFWETHFNDAVAVGTFLAWIKIFKYISFNKTMTQLSSTLGRCAKDLAGFFIMFIIIFVAFTQLGYLIFGAHLDDFRTFINAFFTLFRIILGDFDFEGLYNANRLLGPAYFMLFVFFVFFVLINMFLAIINDTYSEVKSDMANMQSEFEIADYFKLGVQNMVEKLQQKEKLAEAQKALEAADVNKDKQIDFDEWKTELRSRGYADAEIEAMFNKFDKDGNRILDEEEKNKMMAALKAKEADIDLNMQEMMQPRGKEGDESDEEEEDAATRTRGAHATYEEFMVLSRRVDRMEHSIGSVIAKLDAVLVRLEAMEGIKRRTRPREILQVDKEQMKSAVKESMQEWAGLQDREYMGEDEETKSVKSARSETSEG